MARLLEDPVELKSDEVLVIYIVKGKSKRMIEKSFDNLTASDMKLHAKEVEAALRKEIKSFVDNKTFKVNLRSACPNICSSKWVMKWKLVGGIRVIKARLTVRGFEDLATDLSTFASTASRWGQRLILSVCVQRAWDLFTVDISVAFLQGLSFDELATMSGGERRQVAFVPPKGSEYLFQELACCDKYVPDRDCLDMEKTVYGLKDAPRAWRLKLAMVLRLSGGTPLHTDGCFWVWFVAGTLVMVISSHVDDLKGGGETVHVNKLLKLLEENFGELKLSYNSFEHCGIVHKQSEDKKTISICQDHYAAQLQLLDTSTFCTEEPQTPVSAQVITEYQSLLGGCSWLVQTRTDICIYVCALQRQNKCPKVEHCLRLNKVVKWCKRKKFSIVYKQLESPCKVLSVSDSAFRKEDKGALAMRGALIGISESHETHPGGRLHLIEYFARKQRRITRSTYSAELNAASDAYDFAKLVALTMTEILHYQPDARALQRLEETGKLALLVHLVIDARSVYDSLIAEEVRPPTEASLVMLLSQLKEALMCHTLKRLWWVNTHDMVADGLNKGSCSRQALCDIANLGIWTLKHECRGHSEARHVPILSPSVQDVLDKS